MNPSQLSKEELELKELYKILLYRDGILSSDTELAWNNFCSRKVLQELQAVYLQPLLDRIKQPVSTMPAAIDPPTSTLSTQAPQETNPGSEHRPPESNGAAKLLEPRQKAPPSSVRAPSGKLRKHRIRVSKQVKKPEKLPKGSSADRAQNTVEQKARSLTTQKSSTVKPRSSSAKSRSRSY